MLPRRLALSAVVAFVAVAATPAAIGHAVTATSSGSSRTSVVHLRPVTSKGQLKPGYSVSKTYSFASCSAGSEATGNAYRCFAGKSNHSLNRVIDPCWVEGNKRYVVCLRNPWSFNVVELTVSKGYDNSGRTTKHAKLPWGVQLPNGVQCGYLQSAGASINGKRVNYACAHSHEVLYGAVNTSGQVWTIRKATASHGSFTRHGRAQLGIAWFGQASAKG